MYLFETNFSYHHKRIAVLYDNFFAIRGFTINTILWRYLKTILSQFPLTTWFAHSEWNWFRRSSFIFYINVICCFFAHGVSGRGHRTKMKIDLKSADFGDSAGSLPYLTWTWFGFYSLIFRISLSQRFVTQFFREKRSIPWWLLQYMIQNHSP